MRQPEEDKVTYEREPIQGAAMGAWGRFWRWLRVTFGRR